MNIGIVTTWFERGAAYVSKLFEDVLASDPNNNVYIYARGGEEYAIGDKKWDRENVHWGKMRISPFSSTTIDKSDFINWVKNNNIEVVIFNEQHWFQPIVWCKELGVKTVAYIDYYTEETVPLFDAYDVIICNTKRHYSAFEHLNNAHYIPWGTQTDVFKATKSSLVNDKYVTFFHSCGWDINRKGTDLLLKAYAKTNNESKLVIHTQNPISRADLVPIIDELSKKGKLEIVEKTIHAPGLFYMGDIYVYPTRLEGIGLTIAEAISSGLGIIVPDNAPMNEFCNENHGCLINISRFTARADGYYWPKCEADIDHLAQIMDELALDTDTVCKMKVSARNFAEKELNALENFKALISIIDTTQYTKLNDKTRMLISRYDTKGMKRFNKYYLAFYPVFNTVRNSLKK